MQSVNHSRLPGFNEAFFIAKTAENFYHGFNITVKLSDSIVLSRGRFFSALKNLIMRNRWLLYNYYRTKEDGPRDYRTDYKLLYVRLLDLDDVVKYEINNEPIESLCQRLNLICVPLNSSTTPLWMIKVSGENQVSVIFSHTIFDGSSGLQFIRELVTELACSKDDEPTTTVLFNYSLEKDVLPSIVLPLEERFDLYIPSLWQRGKMLLHHYFPRLEPAKPEPQPPFFKSLPAKKSLECIIEKINFYPEDTELLVAFCRKNGFTLTTFFNIVGLYCIEKKLYPFYGTKFSSNNFLAINGRRYYPQKPLDPYLYGMMVCGAPITFPPLSEDLIQDCKKFHSLMQSQIDSREGFKKYWPFSFVDLSEQQNRSIGSLNQYTTMVSNIGKVGSSDKLAENILDAYFSLTTGLGYHFIFNMISTESGGLNLLIHYLPEYSELRDENGQKIMTDFASLFFRTCGILLADG